MKWICIPLWLAATIAAQATTITIVNQDGPNEGLNDPTPVAPLGGNTGTNVGQQRLIVMQRAAALWAARVVSPVTIQVGTKFDPLTCSESSAVLGSTGPHTFFRDFAGAPKSGTYYAVALANALAGTDLDPANVDMDAQFNSNLGQPGCLSSVQWYYGLDGNAPGGTIDLLHVVLHEFAHGLGFLTTVDLASGAKLNGFNDAFMLFLEDHSTGKLYPDMTGAERVAASINTGNLHWVGTNVVNAAGFLSGGRDSGSGHVLMYAPNPQQPGSSVSHFDTSLTPDELMEPFANTTNDRRLTEQTFRDIGWTVLPPIQPNGQAIVSEGCSNGAIDPGEIVTVDLTLKNNGFADAVNLTATLLATNGVTSPGAPQSYGAMTVLGPSVTRSFTFTATGVCGGAISPTLHLQDGAIDYGNVSFSFRLGGTREFTNATAISIPNSGSASPYPSAITISNYAGVLNGLSVRLININHNNPDDLDLLLVGPGGQKTLLMSDCGGTPNLINVTLTFSDFGAASLSDSSQLVSGTFKPSNYDTSSDAFAAPAPAGPYATNLAIFDGTDPNGTWQLFVIDDSNPTSGTISGGWTLVLPVCCAAGNVAPLLTFSPAPTNYTENAPPLVLTPDALVTDTDSTNFNSGSLTIAFTTNGTASDQLAITNDGVIAVSGFTVSFNGSPFGNLSGGTNGSSLVVSFTSTNATPVAAQALCRAVTFFNISDAPATNARAVQFTLNDGAGGISVASKTVAVIAVNDLPTISSVSDRATPEDVSTGAIGFIIRDAETTAGSLTVSGTSSNSTLVPSLVFGGSGSNRTVTILPATNQNGVTLITLFVSDGQLTNSTSFLVTVTPVNDAPTISTITNQTIAEDSSIGPISFTIGDVETAASALTVFGASSNTTLVLSFTFGGSGSNRTVTITPATNQNGTTLVTLFVSDGQLTNSTSFLLTVTPVNDAPIISSLTNQTIFENANTGPIAFTIGDVETAAGSLTVFATSTNTALVPNTNIIFSGSGSNRFLIVSPATNQTGVTLITLSVSDGAATNSTSFLLTVLPLIDLAVSNSMVFDGTNFQVTITLTNSSPHSASDIALTNLLPSGASVLSIDSGAASCATTSGTVVCLFTSLAANTSAVVALTFSAPQADSFTNVSLVSATEVDPDSSNNIAVAILPGVGSGDFDGDGLPDSWELANGTNPMLADANDDPDHDGFTNLQEFLAGTDPHDSNSVLLITRVALEGGTNTITLNFLAVSNRSYSVLSATNVVAGPWERIFDVSNASATGVITITNLSGADVMRFYRIATPAQP